MARGTDFGGIHSYRDLNLIQQIVEESPAEPKLNLIDIPGADGSKDMTTQPAGRVVYSDRIVRWTFGLYPGENWATKRKQVSNALNGRRCKITLDENPYWYYDGRLAVREYIRDSILRQIVVEAICSPYLFKQRDTVVTRSISTTEARLQLTNEFKPVFPQIEVTAATVVTWNGNAFSLSPGKHRLLDVELPAGTSTLSAKTTSGTGTITITYQEGTL